MLQSLLDMLRQWPFWSRASCSKRRSKNCGGGRDQNEPEMGGDQTAGTSADGCDSLDKQLSAMQSTVTVLLNRIRHQPDELAQTPDQECVGCVSGRACMQTFPCAHRVLCRNCFIRTIQVAISERNLPLRCVMCRTRVVRLKYQTHGPSSCTRPGTAGGRAALVHSRCSQPQSAVLQPAYL